MAYLLLTASVMLLALLIACSPPLPPYEPVFALERTFPADEKEGAKDTPIILDYGLLPDDWASKIHVEVERIMDRAPQAGTLTRSDKRPDVLLWTPELPFENARSYRVHVTQEQIEREFTFTGSSRTLEPSKLSNEGSVYVYRIHEEDRTCRVFYEYGGGECSPECKDSTPTGNSHDYGEFFGGYAYAEGELRELTLVTVAYASSPAFIDTLQPGHFELGTLAQVCVRTTSLDPLGNSQQTDPKCVDVPETPSDRPVISGDYNALPHVGRNPDTPFEDARGCNATGTPPLALVVLALLMRRRDPC